MKIESEARQEVEMMKKLTPGTEDYKKHENTITELKAKMEAGREQAEREFTLREAETMATLYKEIQGMTARVGQVAGDELHREESRTRTSRQRAPIRTRSWPRSADPVVYADPRNDITNDVVYYLNQMYEATAKNPAARTPKAAATPSRSGRRRRGHSRPAIDAARRRTIGDRRRLARSVRHRLRESGTGREGRSAAMTDRPESGRCRACGDPSRGLAEVPCALKDEMKGQGMLRATRRQRTIARAAEVRGVGFFHGADVTLRFHPAEPDTGIVFVRTDLPGRPSVPARLDSVVPSQRRTTIRQRRRERRDDRARDGRAGRPADRQRVVEIDAAECPGCDGSSRAFVEALDRAGIVEQDRMRQALVIDRPVTVREGDAVLAAHPPASPGGLTLSYHLDYGRGARSPPRASSSACPPRRSATSWRPAGPSSSRPRPTPCAPPASAPGRPRPTS